VQAGVVLRSVLLTVRLFCLIAGILLLWQGYREWTVPTEGQEIAKASWDEGELERLERMAAPKGAVPPRVRTPNPNAPFLITFPRIGIKRYVIPGATKQNLKRGPTWLRDTVEPGEVGNCIIAGHRDSHFGFLRHVRRGDTIKVSRQGRVATYKIESIYIVDSSNRQPLMKHDGKRLTLITCFPFSFIGSAPQRMIVQAVGVDPDPSQVVSGG
jgi:LPXTG-site transpeptidase (sortase) family protein